MTSLPLRSLTISPSLNRTGVSCLPSPRTRATLVWNSTLAPGCCVRTSASRRVIIGRDDPTDWVSHAARSGRRSASGRSRSQVACPVAELLFPQRDAPPPLRAVPIGPALPGCRGERPNRSRRHFAHNPPHWPHRRAMPKTARPDT